MKRSKVCEKIMKAIKDNFTVREGEFDDDYFIERQVEESYAWHSTFNEKLEGILNEIFPDNPHPITVDNCDSLNDILNNNFKFD